MPPISLFTVGHSNHSAEAFVNLLAHHTIELLADVRSQPYSRYSPQFNRENLAASLKQAGVAYTFMGESLGGRPNQVDLYDPGQERPNYARQRETSLYQQGIARLIELASARRTAIMCSEGDPEQCHRTLLILPSLLAADVAVYNILPDGHLEEAEPPVQQMGFGF